MGKQIYRLVHDEARRRALEAVRTAPAGYVVEVKQATRTLQQNARYWSNGVLAHIAREARVNGTRYSADAWHEHFKRMFVGVIELPNGAVAGMSTTKLSVEEFAAFVEKVEAYAVTELGVVFDEVAA